MSKHQKSGVNSKIPQSHNFSETDYMDSFTQDEGLYHESEDMKQARAECDKAATSRVKKLMQLAEKKLTTQEYRVFIYLTGTYDHNVWQQNDEVKPLSQRETSRRIGISQPRVSELWSASLVKLKDEYEGIFRQD